MNSIRTGDLAKRLGVRPETIRRYVKNQTIPFHRTPAGQLFFTESDVEKITGVSKEITNKIWAFYARSSSGRKESLENQFQELSNAFGEAAFLIKDSASGLNENRKGLKKLINLAKNEKITDIGITYSDRLTRFGFSYLSELFSQNNVTIHILHDTKNDTAENELMKDFMSLIASFSGRFYKMRSKENQIKLLHNAEENIYDKD
jgi:putative resolvase